MTQAHKLTHVISLHKNNAQISLRVLCSLTLLRGDIWITVLSILLTSCFVAPFLKFRIKIPPDIDQMVHIYKPGVISLIPFTALYTFFIIEFSCRYSRPFSVILTSLALQRSITNCSFWTWKILPKDWFHGIFL